MKALSFLAFGLLLTAAAQAQQLAAHADTATTQTAPVLAADTVATPAAAVEEVVVAAAPAAPVVLECATLTGRVTDEFNYPLTGATVMLRSNGQAFSNDAFSTNADGNYLVTSKKPIPRNTVLLISAAGYNEVELPLANCQSLDISLELLPGTKFKGDGRIKKTSTAGKIR